MQIGKITDKVLSRSVLKNITVSRSDVIIHAGVGIDTSAFKAEDEVILMASNSVIGSVKELGNGALFAVANDIAVTGGETIGVLVNVLLPPSTQEKRLKKIIKDMDFHCQKRNIEILGGHTEITDAVNQPLLTITGVGKAKEDVLLCPGQMHPGQDIVATKWIALEGTSLLAKERKEELAKELPVDMIETAQSLGEWMSIERESKIAREQGATALHNASRGGIFGALWEMASASGVGLEVDLKKIPILQETIEVCEVFDVNPYMLKSQGCLLIATEDGNHMVNCLAKDGIHSQVIGKVTNNNDRVIINGEERRFLESSKN